MSEANQVNPKKSKKKYIFFLLFILLIGATGFIKNEGVYKVQNSLPYNNTQTLYDYYENAYDSVYWSEDEVSSEVTIVNVSGKCGLNGENKEFLVKYKVTNSEYIFYEFYLDDGLQEPELAYEFFSHLQEAGLN